MRIVRYRGARGISWGVLTGEVIRRLSHFDFSHVPTPEGAAEPLSTVELLAPIAPPRNVFCLGRNYAEHAREGPGGDQPLPSAPIWFTKAPTTITGPTADIHVPRDLTCQVDWEIELGVVIGRGGKRIPESRALEHVFGYTVLNDLSARDLQFSRNQWFYSKSLDEFLPAGPCVLTADEVPDPQGLELILRVNGEVRQHGFTRDMIFSIAAAIADLSRGITLLPGDVIATGTPAGVGMGRTPPLWLKHGDLVEAEIPPIGRLRNRILFVESGDSPSH